VETRPARVLARRPISRRIMLMSRHQTSRMMVSFKRSDTPPPEFESCGGVLRELDDGHTPETHDKGGQWIDYSFAADDVESADHQQQSNAVHVFDNAFPDELVNSLYETTVKEGRPWGTYVPLDEVERFRNDDIIMTPDVSKRGPSFELQHALSVQAVSLFLSLMSERRPLSVNDNKAKYHCVPSEETSSARTALSIWLSRNAVHGVAIWALASESVAKVPYHVDYAEYVRYRYNVLVPPLWAGTLQCSKYVSSGGEFAANRQGWNHYQKYGYKGCKEQDDMGGWKRPKTLNDDHDPHYDPDTGWITVPYCYNRCVGHKGTLPHVSSPFKLSDVKRRRVIVGFNVFGHDVGGYVQKVPEHSQEFRRRVQQPCSRQQFSLEKIRSNPKLSKWLVLAKREKVRQEFQKAQELLDRDIECLLKEHEDSGMSIEDLMEACGRGDGQWPNQQDVQVHLKRRLRQGTITCSNPIDEPTRQDVIYWKKLLT
jgi:hypothetical protein